MKHPSNKKSALPAAAQKAKKPLVSAKTSVPVKKTTIVSATKPKPTKIKTLPTNSKTQKLKISAPTRTVKITNSNKKQISSVQAAKSATLRIKPKVSTVKTRIAKSQPVIKAKKKEVVKRQKSDDKIKTEKSKESISVKKAPTVKLQPRISANKKALENKKNTENAKTARLPTNTVIRKAKAVKSQTPSKTKSPVKSQPKVSVKNKKVQPKNSEIKSKTANAKSKAVVRKNPIKKSVTVKRNKVQKPSAQIENKTFNSRISKIAKIEDQKIVAVHLVKKLELPAEFTKPKNKKGYEKKQSKLIFKAEQPIQTMLKPKPKKAKPISSAVFRGEKNKYDFTVFPLDAVFEDVPAIYIISRRVVDKSKKAHHALVCIGQTESLLDELKKHKKDKRTKKFAANSISLLREENENRRLKIETDLKTAHAIRCLYT